MYDRCADFEVSPSAGKLYVADVPDDVLEVLLQHVPIICLPLLLLCLNPLGNGVHHHSGDRCLEVAEEELQKMAVFMAASFVLSNGPRSTAFSLGGAYESNPALWHAYARKTVECAHQIGRIYVAQNAAGEMIALALCYDAGREPTDVPVDQDFQKEFDKLSERQKAYKADRERKEEDLYRDVHPPNFRRNCLHVQELSVKEEYKRRGIGSALIKLIVREAEKEGHQTVLETSSASNIAFYEACGFHVDASLDVDHWELGSLPRKYYLSTS